MGITYIKHLSYWNSPHLTELRKVNITQLRHVNDWLINWFYFRTIWIFWDEVFTFIFGIIRFISSCSFLFPFAYSICVNLQFTFSLPSHVFLISQSSYLVHDTCTRDGRLWIRWICTMKRRNTWSFTIFQDYIGYSSQYIHRLNLHRGEEK